ncbi:MAG: uroporphyrinogen-III synthase [Alysiella sp.]|uniref:uroporphyrinogen-III synthase n=1 Tax=Alysiella sp. TaxID=1872483 RepID=UPI0026DB5C2B|nr:uroporphyrinogen-III synthase [Alysiella sp.]MDO4433382.1 uroporphyrinogen-III synthase [Alysiella sp.]
MSVQKTILLVRPANRVVADCVLCQQNAWQAVPFSPICIQELPENMNMLPEKMWAAAAVFWVSPTAVEMAADVLQVHDWQNARHIAVGQASAEMLRQSGASEIWVSQTGNDSEAALALPVWDRLPENANILIVRGEGGRTFLAQQLRQRGFQVQFAEIYRREIQKLDWSVFQAAQAQAAWLTSVQQAYALFEQVPQTMAQKLQSLLYFTHHTRIAQVLFELGALNVHVVPDLQFALNILNSN